MKTRAIYIFTAAILCLVSGTGCQHFRWLQFNRTPGISAPTAFNGPPTLEQITAAVNNNSSKVRQLRAESATVSATGVPTLSAEIALERPKRFRMKASFMQLSGTEMDLGSNDDLFWVWIKRQQPPGIYYARHDEFASSPVRRLAPIEPDWLINALGVVEFDPNSQHEGPYQRGENQWAVRSTTQTPNGKVTREAVIDGTYGWVLEQSLFDERGSMIATSQASQYKWYPEEQVSLPSKVEVKLPASNLAFQIYVPNYQINRLDVDPTVLWSMPRTGAPLVNLTTPTQQLYQQQPLSAAQPAYPQTYPTSVAQQPIIRGQNADPYYNSQYQREPASHRQNLTRLRYRGFIRQR